VCLAANVTSAASQTSKRSYGHVVVSGEATMSRASEAPDAALQMPYGVPDAATPQPRI
jgi:hypothetical protein